MIAVGSRARHGPPEQEREKRMMIETSTLEPTCPLPSKAYNLEMLHQEAYPGLETHGWCFGLPPGISPEQWPLDPLTGYPLVHGFTLRLPPDYRCHGPEITGLSFFAACNEHSDGGTPPDEAIQAAMTGPVAPSDERYRPFWKAAQDSHPRLFRMIDVLDDSFAVILLTEAELNGPPCRPPPAAAASALSCHATPHWISVGSARTYFDSQIGTSLRVRTEEHFVYKQLGGIPDARLDWNRALRWTPRASDPNAGKTPREDYATEKTSGYQQPHYFEGLPKAENFRKHEWAADHARDHIGGTMQPIQATPHFSPFYLEFEEYLGGYNFGGGNCQLDFLNMQLDWACG
jgi:hypothetical protein